MKRLATLLLALLAAGTATAQDITQIDGMDWSLPASVGLSETGGVWGDDSDRQASYIRATFLGVDWRDLNPAKGQFDFSVIDQVMQNENRAPLIIRINWFGDCAAPDWVQNETRTMSERTIVFWDDNYAIALAPLAIALGERYADDPRLEMLYLGFGDGQKSGVTCDSDDDGWGEFWMTDEEIHEAETEFGLTAQRMEDATKHLIDIFANAFGDSSHKLAFTNIALFHGDSTSPYNTAIRNLADHLKTRNVGMRNGQIETWFRYISYVFGSNLTPAPNGTVRLSTDEDFARAIARRHWGDENEFYGPESWITDSNGPYSNQGYRFYVSSMRGLQMRYSHVAVRPDAISDLPNLPWNPQGLLEYQARILGRNIRNTPDAFSMLGERYVDAGFLHGPIVDDPTIQDGMLKIRGVERWLSEVGDSVPALKITMPESEGFWGQYYMPAGIDYEYAARASQKFHFDLSDELMTNRCPDTCDLAVKLTYLAGDPATVLIRTQAGDSPGFDLSTDGEIHTLTFPLISHFANGLENAADFIVESENTPVKLLLVRVVFGDK